MEETGVLLKKKKQMFCNVEGFPWIDVSAIDSKNGCYGKAEDFNSEEEPICHRLSTDASQ
ncbi:hypothetical protein L3C95_09540 [Chitinophaga filiformis]|uniref:hypothetical protein n=1 Tax=Chitinophaga filiformis TaxID=104663 RepID=UPI001F402DF0|nr:hypothetical protein [Chitinophaga filiformis]MCF6403116.1 hypothetical protein [Chitinophaga filiformis]